MVPQSTGDSTHGIIFYIHPEQFLLLSMLYTLYSIGDVGNKGDT